ncbi:MAG: hypothetical protein K2X98_02015, partial [Alphaproteobacteria bacterium]|nr:hypothetical protein [Alphaproteobacteria bacterium]
GHETDFTLLDFVADVRAPTPTAAAELATPVLSQIHTHLQEMGVRMAQTIQKHIQHQRVHLMRFEQALRDPLKYLFEKQQRVDDWAERLHLGIQRFLAQRRLLLGAIDVKTPKSVMDMAQLKLSHLSAGLLQNFKYLLTSKQDKITGLSQALETLSFEKTLNRGFCLVQNSKGQVITSIHNVPFNKTMSLRLKDGAIDVKAIPSATQQGTLF